MNIQRAYVERATVFYGRNTNRSLRRPPPSAPEAVQKRFRELLRAEGVTGAEQPLKGRLSRRKYIERRDASPGASPAAALDLSPYVLSGTAIVYDSLSEDMGGWRERIMPGAFAEAIRNRTSDTLAVIEHDIGKLLGRASVGTLKLSDLPDGLHVTVDLPSTTVASDLFTLVRRGDLSQMSFAFYGCEDAWTVEDGVDVRNVLSVRFLDDVSVVASPAYQATRCEVTTRGANAMSLTRRRLDAIERERFHAGYRRLRRAEVLADAQPRQGSRPAGAGAATSPKR
ncbi:MAG TPA: HK97 family phage prohead protease [Pirellulales bacterium]|jgi:hypothetical protein|nr:HK97 family phage prohead protease [Pirellulales bacterium]